MIYDFGSYCLIGFDVGKSNSMKIVGMKHKGGTNGTLVRSEDGGASWSDITGDWSGNKQQHVELRYSLGSGVVT